MENTTAKKPVTMALTSPLVKWISWGPRSDRKPSTKSKASLSFSSRPDRSMFSVSIFSWSMIWLYPV